MKVSIYLKKQVSLADDLSRSNLCFRVREKSIDIKVVSELVVYDKYWDSETLQYRRNTIVSSSEQKRLAEQISSIIENIERSFSSKADSLWLKQCIEDVLHPNVAFERNHPSLVSRIHEYAERYEGTEGAKQAILRFERQMSRYHDYHREILGEKDFTLFVETLTLEQMNEYREYIKNEYLLREQYPEFYSGRIYYNAKRKELSNTTIINAMNLFCVFLRWCKKMQYSDNDVFERYGCKVPIYGDPFYLTREERNMLYDADLTDHPKLAVIRDIFVFHCYVGCRVGDLYRLTRENIVDGFIEYTPQKTKKCLAKTVRVPLHEKAKAILARHNSTNGKLLPFKPIHQYNLGIRELLKHCGIDRMVTILDTHGYQSKQKPIYELASSHTARKTFVGNLYEQVPDPNLIASMSGHVDGSRAFARYRNIDDDMKRRLVEMIN